MDQYLKVLNESDDPAVRQNSFRLICNVIYLKKEYIDELGTDKEIVKIVLESVANQLYPFESLALFAGEELRCLMWEAIWDNCKNRKDASGQELAARLRLGVRENSKIAFKLDPGLEKEYKEKETEWKTINWFKEACEIVLISKERFEIMKTNPKIVKMIADCARETALKHGFSEVYNNSGKKDPKTENTVFLKALYLAVMERVVNSHDTTPGALPDQPQTEFCEHWIESTKERIEEPLGPVVRKRLKGNLKKIEESLEKRDPLVVDQNGQKVRASRVDHEKFAIAGDPTKGFRVVDRKKPKRDPKRLEAAEASENNSSFLNSMLERLGIF
uniref:VHS domain-containing protein n=1 Tax=Caenorhabditis tropicalis TaxID=1561998 RepID=A0A1I7TUC4_9PELO